MSPNYEKEALTASPRVATAGSKLPPRPTQSGSWTPDSAEDMNCKALRKLKHQRDMEKRGRATESGHGTPKSHRSKQHYQQRNPMQDLRHERGLFMESGSRGIPAHQRGSHLAGSLPSSKSALSAVSWPPNRMPLDDENISPNTMMTPPRSSRRLASSAPSESHMSRYNSPKREMTLFDCAAFFNESGSLLDHEHLDGLGSSPEQSAANRRKQKRRVGRHKTEKKKSDAVDDFNKEDCVLELMGFLLPHIEVAKELNVILLGGQQHGGVFDFEEDDCDLQPPMQQKDELTKRLTSDIDLLKFQAALSDLLFGANSAKQAHPVAGSELSELIQHYFTKQWITRSIVSAVRLDVLAQYDHFAVIHALFRVMPSERQFILESITSTALAIYQHQGVDGVSADQSRTVDFVSMKGMISFIGAALGTIEHDVFYAPNAFGYSADEVDGCVKALCDETANAIRLLARSSPGKSKSNEDNNLVEKFTEGSNSVDATTYAALGDVIYRLATFSPEHGEDLLHWMLRKWPQRNVQLQLHFVRYMAGLLTQFMMRGLVFPSELLEKVFTRLEACIRSPHSFIAKEACQVCGNIQLMGMYLSHDQSSREKIASALHDNAGSHWNDRIREMSDECFDMLLDLA